MTKIQLALTPQEVNIIQSYGDQFGYNLTKTVRFFISKAVEEMIENITFPTYPLNKKLEESGLKARKEHLAGKTAEVKDVETFFKNL